MKVIFVLIGLLFDLVILALSGFVVYSAVAPGVFLDAVDFVKPYLEDAEMRLQIGAVAGVFFIMSFRGLFLLVFGGKERVFVLRRTEQGALTVSRATLEHVISRISAAQEPASKVASILIKQDGDKLGVGMKIRLDITKCNLGEYVDKLDKEVRAYFKDSLGIELNRFDVQAEAGETAAIA